MKTSDYLLGLTEFRDEKVIPLNMPSGEIKVVPESVFYAVIIDCCWTKVKGMDKLLDNLLSQKSLWNAIRKVVAPKGYRVQPTCKQRERLHVVRDGVSCCVRKLDKATQRELSEKCFNKFYELYM